VGLVLRPTTITAAREYVAEHHRHNRPPVGGLFAAGVESDGQLVGVAIAGRPVARALQDGRTIEVTRCCTDGTRNACSMLYGAITRAAKALGWRVAYTYTLDNEAESGASLRASGWVEDERIAPRAGWDTPSRRRDNDRTPDGGRIRWRKELAA
jgi:hypothetical protein